MALRVDQNTLQVTPTPDPVIFMVTCDVTEDGAEVPDNQKVFTSITFRYNTNMTKAHAVAVALAEYNRIKNLKTSGEVRNAMITSLGTSIKPFDRASSEGT